MDLTQTQTPPSYPIDIPVLGPPPCYSCRLPCGEQVIQETRSLHGLADGIFKKQSGGVTVILTGQQHDASIPTYGRRSSVNGAVALDHREGIAEVTAKLLGQMRVHIPVFNSCTVTLVDQQQTLWSCLSASRNSSVCPGTMPFLFELPSFFKDNDSISYPLPPSYDPSILRQAGLTGTCKYHLEVKIVSRGIGPWTKTKKIDIPLEYMPRSRPTQPSLSESYGFSVLKTTPGEWYQSLTTMHSRSPEKLPPVSAHIFIPDTRVFAYSETIPFYVQLSGSRCSLADLSGHSPTSITPPTVTVHLLRQITLEVNGQKDWRSCALAYGEIHAVSPPISNPACTSQDSLDWEGTIQVPKQLECPSFFARHLNVKDFIVLSVVPAEPALASFGSHRSFVPIKIVTDSWAADGPAP
ncbi:hypothetical protein L218DRAFT_367276 [Marasmius fiardii PR-910]|nr:hypothetical protein L218DRAFT_367276 [Marasmius fiardii PR-910]